MADVNGFSTAINVDSGSAINASEITDILATDELIVTSFVDGSDVSIYGQFVFDGDGLPTDGTVESIISFVGGAPVLEISGLSASYAALNNAGTVAGTPGVFAQLLAGNDDITGSSVGDRLRGFAGNDSVFGGDGDDFVGGDDGDDTVLGQLGSDLVRGGAGTDLVGGGPGNDQLEGEAGNDGLDAGDGNDVLLGGDGNDRMIADDGNDTMLGGAGNDLMGGGAGNDAIAGNDGDDIIDGSDYGNDAMDGGLGNDQIALGRGNDAAAGNFGADIFFLRAGGPGLDVIQDFTPGTDLLRNDTGLSLSVLANSAVNTDAGVYLTLGPNDQVLLAGIHTIDGGWFLV